MSDLAIKTALPSLADLGDVTRTLQGHVGQSVNQRFTIERRKAISNKKLRLQAHEFILKDQFGNIYVMFISELMDREVYSVADWIGTDVWRGAGKQMKLVKEYKHHFKRFDDDMLAYLQEKAFVAFGKATLDILKARAAGRLPLTPVNEEVEVAPVVAINS